MKPRLRDVPVLGRDGFLRLAYVEWGSPKAKRTVVCVHGVSRNSRDFDALASELAERGARVVCPDLPGRGRSDWLATSAHYTDRAYTRAMATLLARLDVEQVDWVGTSLGGHIGMLMAAERGSPIRRLVLNDFGARVSAAALRRIGQYLCTDWRFPGIEAAEAHLREIHASFGKLTDAQWRHLAEHSTVADGNGALRFHYDPAIAIRFAVPIMLDVVLWSLWDVIECPVLLLRGESSDLLSTATVEEMQRRGGAARKGQVRAVDILGCGHAPSLMHATHTALIREFLMDEAPSAASARSPGARPSRGPFIRVPTP
jgi:pimeloyl-ACP methyl ester carboxylesterase